MQYSPFVHALFSPESFYGSPPQLFFNEIAGFETSSRPFLLKYGYPRHPDVIVRQSFAYKKYATIVVS